VDQFVANANTVGSLRRRAERVVRRAAQQGFRLPVRQCDGEFRRLPQLVSSDLYLRAVGIGHSHHVSRRCARTQQIIRCRASRTRRVVVLQRIRAALRGLQFAREVAEAVEAVAGAAAGVGHSRQLTRGELLGRQTRRSR
jgi:hypothetical protein